MLICDLGSYVWPSDLRPPSWAVAALEALQDDRSSGFGAFADRLLAADGQQSRDLTASRPIPCKRQPIYAAQLLTNDDRVRMAKGGVTGNPIAPSLGGGAFARVRGATQPRRVVAHNACRRRAHHHSNGAGLVHLQRNRDYRLRT